MATTPLDQVLRLVAEGRLSPEEAGPILDALDGREPAGSADETASAGGATGAARAGPPGALRIEVRDHGRRVVNLRLPIGVGRFALDRVPGLSGEQIDRVREALRSGLRGPVLEVEDDGDGVRIVLE